MMKKAGTYAARSTIVLGLALATVSGCATKGFVRQEVAGARNYADSRVGEVRGEVDQVKLQAEQTAALTQRLAAGNYTEVSSHQVQFPFDDFRLMPEAQGMLDNLATELTTHPSYVIEVRGYADAMGTDRYNYRLGRERADEVYRYLMTRHSVPASRVAIVSFGEESPVADNESDEGRAQNRRAQVRLLELAGAPVQTTYNPQAP